MVFFLFKQMLFTIEIFMANEPIYAIVTTFIESDNKKRCAATATDEGRQRSATASWPLPPHHPSSALGVCVYVAFVYWLRAAVDNCWQKYRNEIVKSTRTHNAQLQAIFLLAVLATLLMSAYLRHNKQREKKGGDCPEWATPNGSRYKRERIWVNE